MRWKRGMNPSRASRASPAARSSLRQGTEGATRLHVFGCSTVSSSLLHASYNPRHTRPNDLIWIIAAPEASLDPSRTVSVSHISFRRWCFVRSRKESCPSRFRLVGTEPHQSLPGTQRARTVIRNRRRIAFPGQVREHTTAGVSDSPPCKETPAISCRIQKLIRLY
jgi:hypothetical protein